MDDLSIFLLFLAVILVPVFVIVLLSKRLKKQKARIADIETSARAEIDQIRREKEFAIEQAKANADARVQEARAEADRRVAEEMQRSAEALRKQSEFIELQRNVLFGKSDKDLLVDILLAVGGYAGRMERLEEKLATEQLQSRISSMSASMESLLYQMTQDLQSQLQETKRVIQEKLSESDVISEIYGIHSQIDDLGSKLDDMKEKLFSGYYGYDSIADQLEKIHDAVSDSSNSDIKDKLDFISSELYSIQSAANDAKSAAESAVSAIESR